jgi:hypothetical protein
MHGASGGNHSTEAMYRVSTPLALAKAFFKKLFSQPF